MGITVLLIWLGIYVYFALALQVIANKTNVENGWLAWIPIANFYLMCKIAGLVVFTLFPPISKYNYYDHYMDEDR